MPLLDNLKTRYKLYETKKLAKLAPAERADILACEGLLKQYSFRTNFIFIAIWGLGLFFFRWLTDNQVSWFEAAVLSLIVVSGVGLGLLSAWFGHARYTPGIKLFMVTIGLAIAGGVVGGVIGRFAKHGFDGFGWSDLSRLYVPVLVGGLVAGLVYFGLMITIVQFRRSQLQRRNEELVTTAQKERLARQLTDARLKLLQAQVEPHFLFNTLASVQHLAESRAPEAAALTSQLIIFLRSGLSGLREESSTLQREFIMVEAYLAIMKTRMDHRLTYRLELPPTLGAQPVPPAMLISLVENAIKHGLEPHPPGGEVVITASIHEGQLSLSVKDNGRGTVGRDNNGLGLSNIRERIEAIYGEAASLTTQENTPSGFIATLRLPVSIPASVPLFTPSEKV